MSDQPSTESVLRERPVPWVTYFLIVINFVVWFYELAVPKAVDSLAMYWPDALTNGFRNVLTSMFAHASWQHIVGNMAFLLTFGPKIENLFASHPRKYLGHMGYLTFYLMGGYVAAFGFVASGGYYESAVGASGAIAFVLGLFWFVFPRSIVTVPLSDKKVRTFYYLGLWFVLQAFFDFIGGGGGVAYAAHVWGFLFGVFVAWGFQFQKFYGTAFGLLERPWRLSAKEALDALGALID